MSAPVPIRFEFATATRIVFGAGSLGELGGIAKPFGKRALLVTGRDPMRAQPVMKRLAEQQIETITLPIPDEPTTDLVRAGIEIARREKCEFVVACGGGSAMDAGKSIAALLTNSGELLDYLEVVGRAQPLTQPAAPLIAIPTTAGTGCEVTRNAVLASPEHRFKVSLRSQFLLPRVALVDPELTRALPRAITASTGMDALTQLVEPFVSVRANPLTDALCTDGIRRAARSLRRAFEQPDDMKAREDMSLAALLGGLALANAGLGAVHGFAAPIGGEFHAPHGAVCAALLPHVMEANIRALSSRAPESKLIGRYQRVSRLLTGDAAANVADGVRWVTELASVLMIPRLRTWGIASEHVPALVEKATQASSMKANPIALTRDELAEIMRRAI